HCVPSAGHADGTPLLPGVLEGGLDVVDRVWPDDTVDPSGVQLRLHVVDFDPFRFRLVDPAEEGPGWQHQGRPDLRDRLEHLPALRHLKTSRSEVLPLLTYAERPFDRAVRRCEISSLQGPTAGDGSRLARN